MFKAQHRARLTLRWRGGSLTDIDVDLPRQKPAIVRTDEDTIALVRRLAAYYPDAVIAGILNRQDRHTAYGHRFTANHVSSLRRQWNIPRFEPPATLPEGELLTVEQAAAVLGTATSTIHRWLNDGFIGGEQLTPGAPWRIRLTEDLRDGFVNEAPKGFLTMYPGNAPSRGLPPNRIAALNSGGTRYAGGRFDPATGQLLRLRRLQAERRRDQSGGSYDYFSQSCTGVLASSLEDAWLAAINIVERAGGDPGYPGLQGPPEPPPAQRPRAFALLRTVGWDDRYGVRSLKRRLDRRGMTSGAARNGLRLQLVLLRKPFHASDGPFWATALRRAVR